MGPDFFFLVTEDPARLGQDHRQFAESPATEYLAPHSEHTLSATRLRRREPIC